MFMMTMWSIYSSNAQQDAQLSMYMFNMFQYNPAYAGSKECPNAVAIYRHQWENIKGAPRTMSLNFHTPLKKDQYALGASIRGDRLGRTMFAYTEGSFAYRVKIQEDVKLSLGVSAGLAYYQVNFQPERSAFTLDNLLLNNPNKMLPNFGVGAYLYSPKYYVGLSMPHILTSSLREKIASGEIDSTVASQFNHIYATAGVILGKNENLKFRPSVFLKYVNGAPISFDVNMSVLLKERFWIGASYRFGGDIYDLTTGLGQFGSGNAVIGFFKFLVTPKLEIGYAYDFTMTNLNLGTSGTHELMMGLTLCKNKNIRYVTPRYISYF